MKKLLTIILLFTAIIICPQDNNDYIITKQDYTVSETQNYNQLASDYYISEKKVYVVDETTLTYRVIVDETNPNVSMEKNPPTYVVIDGVIYFEEPTKEKKK